MSELPDVVTDLITNDARPDAPEAVPLTGGADVESSAGAAVGAAFGLGAATGQWKDVRKRFLRNKLAVVGLAMVIFVVIIAIFAPWLAPYDPHHQDLFNTESPPSAQHWFGTDVVGRDQLSRVMYGARIALLVGVVSIFLAAVIGVVLGAIAGYFGRFWDSAIMRICDIFFAFPVLVGAIVIITVVGQGVTPVILALAIFGWSTIARLLRGSILSIREAEYVEAARSLGATRWRIVTRHILPNSFAPGAHLCGVQHRRRGGRRVVSLLPRGRCETRRARMGKHDRRRSEQFPDRALAVADSQRRGRLHRVGLRLRGRRPA